MRDREHWDNLLPCWMNRLEQAGEKGAAVEQFELPSSLKIDTTETGEEFSDEMNRYLEEQFQVDADDRKRREIEFPNGNHKVLYIDKQVFIRKSAGKFCRPRLDEDDPPNSILEHRRQLARRKCTAKIYDEMLKLVKARAFKTRQEIAQHFKRKNWWIGPIIQYMAFRENWSKEDLKRLLPGKNRQSAKPSNQMEK